MKKIPLSIGKPDASKLQKLDAFIDTATVGTQVSGSQPPLPSAPHPGGSPKSAELPVSQDAAAAGEPMTKFPLQLPVWMHNKIRHLTIDRKESMSEFIVERLLRDPELQKPSETTSAKQGQTIKHKTIIQQ